VTEATGGSLRIWAPDGIGEVGEGTDLVALVASALPDLADGDVVVVTSKIVSKAEADTWCCSRATPTEARATCARACSGPRGATSPCW